MRKRHGYPKECAIVGNEDLSPLLSAASFGLERILKSSPLNEEDGVKQQKRGFTNKVRKILGDVVEVNGDIVIPKDGRMAEMTHGILLQFCKTGKQERLDLNQSKHVIEIVRTECSKFKIIEARRNRKCEIRCTIM